MRSLVLIVALLVAGCRMGLDLGTDLDGGDGAAPDRTLVDVVGEDRALPDLDASDAQDVRLDVPSDRDAEAQPDVVADVPADTGVEAGTDANTDVVFDGGLGERGAACTSDRDCRGLPCHPVLRRCGERCDRGTGAGCPSGTACVIPGDIAGVCLTACSRCGSAECGAGYRCVPARLGEPGSETACVPEELPLSMQSCGPDGGVDAGGDAMCSCGPESCGTATCGRSSCGYLCGTCPAGANAGCFMGACNTSCPGTPCIDVSGQAVCEGGRGAVACPGDSSMIQICTCTGGGPSAWTGCSATCACRR